MITFAGALILGLGIGMGLLLVLRYGRSSAAPSAGQRLAARLSQHGLPDQPLALLAVCGFSAAVAGAGGAIAGRGILFASVAAIVGASAPVVALLARARARRSTLAAHWPDLVDHLVAELRSGKSLPDALGALHHHVHPALRTSIRECDREWRSTGRLDLALDRLKQSCADPVADRIVEIVRMTNEVGGRRSVELLRALASNLREDRAVEEEIRSRRSWVMNTARLGLAAPWIVLVLLGSRPEASAAYSTPGGALVLSLGLIATVLAYRIVVMIGRTSRERRWMA